MAVYTKEYESQPEAILTNVIICPAVDLSANVAVPVHCQVENVLWDTGATNTLISQEVVNALGLQPKNKALISSAGGDVESWHLPCSCYPSNRNSRVECSGSA